MSTEPFIRLRLVGTRYDDHSVPLEFLKDVAVLEEMVVEVAKSKFRADHPNRQRSPRGFTKNIHLRLAAIHPGRATLDIELASESSTLFPPDNQVYFGSARDAIIQGIGAAEHEQPIEPYLPERTLSYFDKLGRSLKEGEAVEFDSPDHKITARLTRDIRRRLVLASPKVKELTEEISIRGAVPEADQDDMSFEIQLIDGSKVKAPIASQHLDTVLEAFNGYQTGMRALFQGIGRFSRGDRLIAFDSIEHLSILDTLDVGAQLDELRLLHDGWLGGEGLAPPSAGLDWLHGAFERHFPDETQLPHLYPTEAGGVQAEWSLGPNEVTFDVNLETHSGEWHVLDMESGAASERKLNCDDGDDWKWLVKQIEALIPGLV